MKTFKFNPTLAIAAATVAAFFVSAPASAEMLFLCRNTSGLTSGVSVVIQTDTTTNLTEAVLTERRGLGPFVELGKIPVTRQAVPSSVMGAPITYLGNNFKLQIFWDGGPDGNGGLPSDLYADVNGRVFNEPMICTIPRQA